MSFSASPFQAFLTTQQILNGKPAPDIFIAAAKRFRQAPASCESVLVFEDSPLGVQAAAAANMRVVWVPCEDEPPADAPENVPMADRELVTRINSLVDFQPEKFGLPAFD